MRTFPPHLWNVNSFVNSDEHMSNRTINPIESYNNRIQHEFGVVHPTLLVFVDRVKVEAARFLWLLDDIAMNRRSAPPHADQVNLVILPANTSFVGPGPQEGRAPAVTQ
jgi:hypothetical protein